MDINSILQVLVGLAFFLYGMSVMSSSLEKMAGGKLETSMKKVTSNPLMSFLLGALITIAIQSSSGAMVMLVGLVNSGIIEFSKTLPIILGSNVGTTFTGWLLSLTSVSSNEFSIWTVLNPKFFAPILAFIGIILKMAAKKERQKDIGVMLIGFTILMYGMNFMSASMGQIADMPWFSNMLMMFTNPILALVVATLFTGLIQSSAATIGIIEAFALSGSVTYQMALPLVLGANIGTCITGVIGAIGTNKNAKRVAVLQVLVNSICALVILAIQLLLSALNMNSFLLIVASAFGVAMIHTLFNIANTIFSFVLQKPIIKLCKAIVKEGDTTSKILIDERLLQVPSVAISECLNKTKEMASMVMKNLNTAFLLLKEFDDKQYEELQVTEQVIDWYEDELDTFLVKLSKLETSDDAGKTSTKCLHVITDYERIGDHAYNIAELSKKMYEENSSFTNEALKELKNLIKATKEILDHTFLCFENEDLASGAQVEPLEEVIDYLSDKMSDSHIKRLREGTCTIEQGLNWSELLNNIERISDHCSNIAVAVIESDGDDFYTHEYLNNMKHESETFKALYKYYFDKYDMNKNASV